MRNEITFHNHQKGLGVAKALLDESYVVMLSYEEDLLVVNYEWTPDGADRNGVVFMSQEKFFDELKDFAKEVREDCREELENFGNLS